MIWKNDTLCFWFHMVHVCEPGSFDTGESRSVHTWETQKTLTRSLLECDCLRAQRQMTRHGKSDWIKRRSTLPLLFFPFLLFISSNVVVVNHKCKRQSWIQSHTLRQTPVFNRSPWWLYEVDRFTKNILRQSEIKSKWCASEWLQC